MPIEGSQLINGSPQKRADEVAGEAIIALTLTHLRHGSIDPGKQNSVCLCLLPNFKPPARSVV